MIAQARGGVRTELVQSLSNNTVREIFTITTLDFQGCEESLEIEVEFKAELLSVYLWPRHNEEGAHKRVAIQSGQGARTTENLLKLSSRLQQPAAQTFTTGKMF